MSLRERERSREMPRPRERVKVVEEERRGKISNFAEWRVIVAEGG